MMSNFGQTRSSFFWAVFPGHSEGTNVHNLYAFMIAMFAALIMVPVLRRWALERQLVDELHERKVHTERVPRLGGIAIFMAFLFAVLIYAEMTPLIRGALTGGLVVFFTGLVDDFHNVAPKSKFIGEIAGATLAIVIGGIYISRLGNLFGTGEIILPFWLGVPFTIFAIVGVINAINLIDGLDGLAGGISVIALVAFFVLGMLDGNPSVMVLCAALLGAVFGFLKYNFYPARIFMGDAGSLTLGFALAFIAIMLTQAPGSQVSPAIPVLILGLPILDTLRVMLQRFMQGTSLLAPDMTHVHHQFLDLGFKHRFTVITIYGISIFWAIFSVLFSRTPEYLSLFVFLVFSALFYALLRHVLNHRERYTFLAKDSTRGIRESGAYHYLAELVNRLVPGLFALLMTYLGVAALFGAGTGTLPWQVGGLLFVAAGVLLLLSRDTLNQFLLGLLYIVGLAMIFVVEAHSERTLLAGITLRDLTDFIFVIVAAIVVGKFFFKATGDFFISTADFLVLGTSIFLSIIVSHYGVELASTSILLKGILLYLGVKVVTTYGSLRASNIMVYSMMTTLLIVSVRSFFSI
jgi:UDP-GlcNAc:undecaprenyl-phosphate GlcNAc-1-phosphate transferase